MDRAPGGFHRRQRAAVQDARKAAADPQAKANGYLQPCVSTDGIELRLTAAPAQYDRQSAAPSRGPVHYEHGDAILTGPGLDMDAIIDLRTCGVIA